MTDEIIDYAKRVVDGHEEGVGHLHRMACQRFLRDLEKSEDPTYRFIYDPSKAKRIIDFAEMITITEGVAPQKIKLLPFQKFILGNLIGWVYRDDRSKMRYSKSYISMARQNGKSLINSILALWFMLYAGYRDSLLFCCAVQQSQAKIVYDSVVHMINADPDLADLFEIRGYRNEATATVTGNTISALSSQTSRLDGKRCIFCSCDELHQHPDGSVYRAMENNQKAIKGSHLLSTITTRGLGGPKSFAYQIDSIAVSILENEIESDTMFCDIFAIDDGDNPFAGPEVWAKANPYLSTVPELVSTMVETAEIVKAMPSGKAVDDFKCKSLNLWTERSENRFLTAEMINKCLSDDCLGKHIGETCCVGIDLAHASDLTSIGFLFGDPTNGLFFQQMSWLPKGRLDECADETTWPLHEYINQGWLEATGGSDSYRCDYEYLMEWLRRTVRDYDLHVQAVGYDNHNIDCLLGPLQEALPNVPLISVTQSARNLNDATVDLQMLAKEQRLSWDRRDELMTNCARCAVLSANSFGEVKIDKVSYKTERIDPLDCLVDARHAQMSLGGSKVDLSDSLDEYLQMMHW